MPDTYGEAVTSRSAMEGKAQTAIRSRSREVTFNFSGSSRLWYRVWQEGPVKIERTPRVRPGCPTCAPAPGPSPTSPVRAAILGGCRAPRSSRPAGGYRGRAALWVQRAARQSCRDARPAGYRLLGARTARSGGRAVFSKPGPMPGAARSGHGRPGPQAVEGPCPSGPPQAAQNVAARCTMRPPGTRALLASTSSRSASSEPCTSNAGVPSGSVPAGRTATILTAGLP